MSDGYDATPGHRGRSDSDNASQSFTRTQQPSPGTASSERRVVSELRPNQRDSNGGNHTDGVSVADLFARMGSVASSPRGTTRHRLDDEPAELPNGAAWQNVVTGRIRGLR